MRMIYSAALAAMLTLPALAAAQDTAQVRKMLEAGQYDEVTNAAQQPESAPEIVYLAAQSAQKQGNQDGARDFYNRLTVLADDNPWNRIGVSGAKLLDNDTDGARAAAEQAVQNADGLPEAHYQ